MRPDAVRYSASRLLDLPNGEAIAAAALCVIFAIGGSGVSYPLLQAAAQILSLLLLALALARDGRAAAVRIRQLEWAILAVIVAVPALQLVPIDSRWWSALPGHALPAQILQAVGLGGAARAVSLSVPDTMLAMATLLPGLALFVAGRQLNPAGRRTLLWTIFALAVLSATLGAVQTALGATAAPSYLSAQSGQGIGLFVNRNHQATFLLVALCLAGALLGREAAPGRRLVVAVVMFLCIAGVVATTSRTALILLPLSLATVALREPWSRRGKGGLVLLVGVALAGGLWFNGGLTRTLDRFNGGPDARMAFWRTGAEAARAYWPQGSGIGSFARVYPLFEHRADIDTFVVNHAHQDYLELLIEAGVFAVVGRALLGAWYLRHAARLLRAAPSSPRREQWSVFWAILVVLVFSAVEYPLRATPVMALFGLLCALLDPLARGVPNRAQGGARAWRVAAIAVAALACSAWLTAGGWSQHALADGNAALALRLQPRSADAQATRWHGTRCRHGTTQRRRAQARAALALIPIDQEALTTFSVASRRTSPADAGRLLTLSADSAGATRTHNSG